MTVVRQSTDDETKEIPLSRLLFAKRRILSTKVRTSVSNVVDKFAAVAGNGAAGVVVVFQLVDGFVHNAHNHHRAHGLRVQQVTERRCGSVRAVCVKMRCSRDLIIRGERMRGKGVGREKEGDDKRKTDERGRAEESREREGER